MRHDRTIVRPWVKWVIASVWLLTAVLIAILTHTHTPTSATVTVRSHEIYLGVNPSLMMNSADQRQFSVSGPAKLNIVAASAAGPGEPPVAKVIAVDAPTTAASCSFYFVRTEPLNLADAGLEGTSSNAGVTLLWPEHSDSDSLVLRVQEKVSGSIEANRGQPAPSSFFCSGVSSTDPGSYVLQGTLSDSASTTFRTYGDAQLTFHAMGTGSLEGNLHVVDFFRVEHVDPLSLGEDTSTLLDPLPGEKNQVIFDDFSRRMELNNADLLEIEPGKDFYIRRLAVNNGIDLELHGTVRDVRVGAGTRNMKSDMPSLFDLLDTKKRFFTIIPSIVAFVLGLLEAVGMLPRKSS